MKVWEVSGREETTLRLWSPDPSRCDYTGRPASSGRLEFELTVWDLASGRKEKDSTTHRNSQCPGNHAGRSACGKWCSTGI